MENEKRLIDANSLIDKHGSDITNFDKPFGVYIQSIRNAPTVDAVPVVRCKNCIYYHKELGYGFGKCSKSKLLPYPDDFCSYGENKL